MIDYISAFSAPPRETWLEGVTNKSGVRRHTAYVAAKLLNSATTPCNEALASP